MFIHSYRRLCWTGGFSLYCLEIWFLKGFWQDSLSKGAGEILAFITSLVSSLIKCFQVIQSFGLWKTPVTSQGLMNMAMSGLEGNTVYLDDVVVYSDTCEDLIHHMTKLFDWLLDTHLSVNLAKCEFTKANYHLAWEESGASASAASSSKSGSDWPKGRRPQQNVKKI